MRQLDQLNTPAREALAAEARKNEKSRKERRQKERKNKIDALKRILLQLQIPDISFVNFTQFKIHGMLFVVTYDKRRYKFNLVARAKCEKCKAVRDSIAINNLVELGRALTGDYWGHHPCRPGGAPPPPPPVTREAQAYKLLGELRELMFGNLIDPSHIDNWPPQ